MKTNKPEVVCHAVKAVGAPVTLKFIVREDIADEYMNTLSERHPVVSSSPLIHLSAYEALQAESEKLRAAIRRLCNIYVVDDYYEGHLRDERLEAAVNRAINAVMETTK